jgi:hypothetical protein
MLSGMYESQSLVHMYQNYTASRLRRCFSFRTSPPFSPYISRITSFRACATCRNTHLQPES